MNLNESPNTPMKFCRECNNLKGAKAVIREGRNRLAYVCNTCGEDEELIDEAEEHLVNQEVVNRPQAAAADIAPDANIQITDAMKEELEASITDPSLPRDKSATCPSCNNGGPVKYKLSYGDQGKKLDFKVCCNTACKHYWRD